MVEIKELFSITKEELESKKYNIFIAICLGNKFFLNKDSINEKNIKEYLDFALKYSKDKVMFLIADKIQATNYNVRNHDTSSYNERRVLREGIKIKEQLSKLVNSLPKEIQEKVDILSWEEYEEKDLLFKETTKIVYEEFRNNQKFKNQVLEAIKTTMTDREFREEQYWTMCNYLLDEFSLVYSGIIFKEIDYRLFFYPTMDSTSHFIEDLKQGKIFPELTKKLPKEIVSLAIVN